MARSPQLADHAVLVLDPDIRNVARARRFVVDAIGTDDQGPRRDAALLTSELVTNAVAHTSTPVKVEVKVERTPDRARVEVYDGSRVPPTFKPLTLDRESGRGLAIVDAIADAWGVAPVDDHGKVVWFELGL
jgi:anti-sigma regulatory factor (Ser/Thr protein kinase)